MNFQNSYKVLLTDNLIGFKPQETLGLDMTRIPKVVTTPDLFSVYEAIEESLGSDTQDHEVEILKKVDRKSTRLNSSHVVTSRMPSSA